MAEGRRKGRHSLVARRMKCAQRALERCNKGTGQSRDHEIRSLSVTKHRQVMLQCMKQSRNFHNTVKKKQFGNQQV